MCYLDMIEERIEKIVKELEAIEGNPDAESRVDELLKRLERYSKLRDAEVEKLHTERLDEERLALDRDIELNKLRQSKIQTWTTIGMGVGQLGLGVANLGNNIRTRNMVLEFENTGSVSSLMGKGLINNLMRK